MRILLTTALLATLLVGIALASAAQAASPRSDARVAVIVTTADLHQALSRLPDLSFTSTPPPPGTPVISINDAATYQTFKGLGAAMTDSSACLLHNYLAPTTRAAIMQSLFSPGGIHLNFLRIPMGASDYTCSGTPYSYDDLSPGQSDPRLARFSIAHDVPYVLPTLRQALLDNPSAFVIAAPWSAPAWMKSNDNLDNVNDGGQLLTSDYTPLANYFVRFLRAYAAAGIHVTAVTPENEPGNPTAYPGMNLDERGEAAFIRYHLIPAFTRAHLDTAIYGNDYGWGLAGQRFAFNLVRSPAARYLTGMATHCYYGSPSTVARLHARNPKLDEIVSECSPGITPYSAAELEIAALRNWASAVALWNLALDPAGEPVEPPNAGCPGCSGVVTIDEQAHSVARTAAYYQLGQLSKYASPGAVRIGSNTFVRYGYAGPGQNVASPGLDDVALRNPDGSEVLVGYNNSPLPVTFSVRSLGRYVTDTVPSGATVTLVWR